jgi:hypothetical protein
LDIILERLDGCFKERFLGIVVSAYIVHGILVERHTDKAVVNHVLPIPIGTHNLKATVGIETEATAIVCVYEGEELLAVMLEYLIVG